MPMGQTKWANGRKEGGGLIGKHGHYKKFRTSPLPDWKLNRNMFIAMLSILTNVVRTNSTFLKHYAVINYVFRHYIPSFYLPMSLISLVICGAASIFCGHMMQYSDIFASLQLKCKVARWEIWNAWCFTWTMMYVQSANGEGHIGRGWAYWRAWALRQSGTVCTVYAVN